MPKKQSDIKNIKSKTSSSKPKRKRRTKDQIDKDNESKKRLDFQINDQLITEAFAVVLGRDGKKPTLKELSEETGLDITTIHRHLKEVNIQERFNEFRIGTSAVVSNLFKQAVTGKNPAIIKLWFDVMEMPHMVRKTDITTNGKEINTPINQTTIKIKSDDGEEINIEI